MTQPISPETVVDDDEPFAEPVTDTEADEDAELEEVAEEVAPEQSESFEPPVDAAKEQRRIAKALEAEKKAHDRKLEKILGEAHEHVLPCPLCSDGLQGYVFPGDGSMLDDERLGAVLAFVGLGGDGRLREAEGVIMCDRCDGWGELKYPSRKENYATQPCPACNGNGYKVAAVNPSNVTPIVTTSAPTYTPPPNEVGPCPICQAPNSAGKPHFCNPIAATGV